MSVFAHEKLLTWVDPEMLSQNDIVGKKRNCRDVNAAAIESKVHLILHCSRKAVRPKNPHWLEKSHRIKKFIVISLLRNRLQWGIGTPILKIHGCMYETLVFFARHAAVWLGISCTICVLKELVCASARMSFCEYVNVYEQCGPLDIRKRDCRLS